MKYFLLSMQAFALSFILLTTGWAEDPYNPKPCTEDYKCIEKPIITASPSGDTHLCQGSRGTWRVNGYISDGKKKKCDEYPVTVTPNGIVWGFKVTGPDGTYQTSGAANSFEWTPSLVGTHTITWTGYASGAEPCQVDSVTKTQVFEVEGPACDCTLGTITACPGDTATIPWTIHNPSYSCTFTYLWTAYPISGDPTVTPYIKTGSISVGPGATLSGTVDFDISSSSLLGTKEMKFDVAAGSQQVCCTSRGAVVVDVMWSIVGIDNMGMCIGENKDTAFGLKNECEHSISVSWDINKIDGNPTGIVAPGNGTVDVPANSTSIVNINIDVPATSPGGIEKFKISGVSSGITKESAFEVSVFKPISLSHNMNIFQKWTSGMNAHVILAYEGDISYARIVYELYNVEERTIQWTLTSSSAEIDVPIEKPGRYVVRAHPCQCYDCVVLVAPPTFTAWTLTVDPESLTYDWDEGSPNKAIDAAFKTAIGYEEQAAPIGAAILAGLKVAGAKSKQVTSELTAVQSEVQKTLADAQSSLDDQSGIVTEQTRVRDNATAERGPLAQEQGRLAGQISQKERRLVRLLAQQPVDQAAVNTLSGEISALNARRAQMLARVAQLNAIISDANAALTKAARLIRLYNQVISDCRAFIGELNGLIAANVTKVAAKIASINARSTALVASLNRSIPAIVAAGGRVLVIASIVMDARTALEFDEENEKIKQNLAESERLRKAAENELAHITLDRKKGPLEQPLVMTSIPGGMTFVVEEKNVSFITKDTGIRPNESRFNGRRFIFTNLITLEGSYANYKNTPYATSQGVTGTRSLSFGALGNLGSSSLVFSGYIDHQVGANASAVASGLTEEQMLEFAHVKEAERIAFWESFALIIKSVGAGIAAILGLGGLIALAFGAAFGGPLILIAGIIGGIAALVALGIGWFLTNSTLDPSIIKNYPTVG